MHGDPAITVVIMSFQIMEAESMGKIERHSRFRKACTVQVRICTTKQAEMDYNKIVYRMRRDISSECSRYIFCSSQLPGARSKPHKRFAFRDDDVGITGESLHCLGYEITRTTLRQFKDASLF